MIKYPENVPSQREDKQNNINSLLQTIQLNMEKQFHNFMLTMILRISVANVFWALFRNLFLITRRLHRKRYSLEILILDY